MPAPDLHTDFRDHFLRTYGEGGTDYSRYEPYYAFGYDYALDDEFEDWTYEEAKAELQSRFAKQFPGLDYDAFEEAVRYGYSHTRRTVAG